LPATLVGEVQRHWRSHRRHHEMSPRPDFGPLRATVSLVARELASHGVGCMPERASLPLVTAVHPPYCRSD
jgi:hypothetical protein